MDRIDIHSHILYGIDDGSKTLDESIEIIKQQKGLGFTDIILTPHYIEKSKYQANNNDKKAILEELRYELKKQEIDINLYLGNEIYIADNILELLDRDEVMSLNNSKYLLIELPLYTTVKNAQDIIYELKIKGYIPVIAHPERYDFVQKNIKSIEDFLEDGVLLQANYGSIIGVYGSSAKKTVKKLLKNGFISFLGTDIHFPNSKIYNNMAKIDSKIKKIVGEDSFNELVFTNPKKILIKKV